MLWLDAGRYAGTGGAGAGPAGLVAAVRILPVWIELRRDRLTSSWLLICRACGIKERYDKFWPASYAAHEHADMHAAELDEYVESAQLLRLGRQAGLVSQSEDVLAGLCEPS